MDTALYQAVRTDPLADRNADHLIPLIGAISIPYHSKSAGNGRFQLSLADKEKKKDNLESGAAPNPFARAISSPHVGRRNVYPCGEKERDDGRPATAKAPCSGGQPWPRSPAKGLPAMALAARKSGQPQPAHS
ncbi:hypothetical protein GW17_00024612 [Ensete ventricosum]|nr:hypothetical protein GW17_00024612 [Ensete ventricosum]